MPKSAKAACEPDLSSFYVDETFGQVPQREALPFIKWVGGKRLLLDALSRQFPAQLQRGDIDTYCEPFLGGGAVFFFIASRRKFKRIWLSDINPDLVLAYQIVRDEVETLIERLETIAEAYFAMDQTQQAAHFQTTRERFNQRRTAREELSSDDAKVEHVSHFIFLNKTCYGGMFRINKKGHFNVPFGKHKRPQIVAPANLREVSRVLAPATIQEASYDALPDDLDERSFVYFDPPYRPLSETASFNQYHGNIFGDREQKALAALFRTLDQRGAKLMLSNSDPKNEDPHDHFFEELYAGYDLQRVQALRKINSNFSKRGRKAELVITNYGPHSTYTKTPNTAPQQLDWLEGHNPGG